MDNPYMPGSMDKTFGNPFKSLESTARPGTVREMFDWAEYMWCHFGTYAQAIRNSIRYFVTDIEVAARPGENIGYETRVQYRGMLRKTYGILDQVAQVGEDRVAFGNSFTSVTPRFRRELVCGKCSFEGPMDQWDWKMENKHIMAPCPQCGDQRKAREPSDKMHKAEDGSDPAVRVVRWAPRHILIDHCPVTGRSEYSFKAPSEWKTKLLNASKDDPLYMEELPWEMIQAILDDKDFKFDGTWFHHSRVPCPSHLAFDLNGWGMPLFMSQFGDALLLQTLKRYNEAVVRDYLIPFRVVSPPPSNGSSDPMRHANGTEWSRNVMGMIKKHRMDPAGWHTLPFPVQYQALGGEGKELLTVDLMENAQDSLLTGMGIPAEFYRTGLGLQSNPVGIRMFERVWAHHVRGLDDWLDWYLGCCHRLLGWERVTASLALTSVHEDESAVSVKMDLAAAGKVSMRTAFEAVNLDADVEKARIRDEEEEAMLEQMEREQEAGRDEAIRMQLASQPPMTVETAQGELQAMADEQAGPPMGPPPQGGGGGGAPGGGSPGDLMASAEEKAMEIVRMDQTARRKELAAIRKAPDGEAFAALVNDAIRKIEQDAGLQGKMMMRQGQM